jgi:hypothetical protein
MSNTLTTVGNPRSVLHRETETLVPAGRCAARRPHLCSGWSGKEGHPCRLEEKNVELDGDQ